MLADKSIPSAVRVDLGASLLVLKQGLQHKLNVHLRLNVFYDSPNLTRTTSQNVKRFRGGLVFKAHRLVHHSTLGWRVIKKKMFFTPLVYAPGCLVLLFLRWGGDAPSSRISESRWPCTLPCRGGGNVDLLGVGTNPPTLERTRGRGWSAWLA